MKARWRRTRALCRLLALRRSRSTLERSSSRSVRARVICASSSWNIDSRNSRSTPCCFSCSSRAARPCAACSFTDASSCVEISLDVAELCASSRSVSTCVGVRTVRAWRVGRRLRGHLDAGLCDRAGLFPPASAEPPSPRERGEDASRAQRPRPSAPRCPSPACSSARRARARSEAATMPAANASSPFAKLHRPAELARRPSAGRARGKATWKPRWKPKNGASKPVLKPVLKPPSLC